MDVPPIDWLATISYQVDPDAHGDVSLGIRRGDFAATVRTDTTELRWSPEGDRGSSWVALRAQAWAYGLIHAPWTDGAPDPSRGLVARAGVLEAGTVRYLPRGLYAGGRLAGTGLLFAAQDATATDTRRGAVPDPRGVVTVEAIAGWWRSEVAAYARAGADAGTLGLSPHIVGELHWAPRWVVAPRVELWAGWAEGQDFTTRTRLGGLNPWVVPLAGAGWGELWVEDYAAARLGPTAGTDGVRGGPFVDLAAFDGGATAGFGGELRVWRKRAFVDLAAGYAPWIERQEGVSRLVGWVSLGMDWGHGWTPRGDTPAGPLGSQWPR